MAANTTAFITCVLASGTTAASWNASYLFDQGGGVTSITGTANQVIASASTGNVTLSTPQDIATSSSPTFAGLTLSSPLTVGNGGTGLSSLTTNGILYATGSTTMSQITTANNAILTTNGSGVPSMVVASGVSGGTPVLQTTGTWTPADQTGAGVTFSSVSASYTRIGNMVWAYCQFTVNATGSGSSNVIGGLPFTVANASYASQGLVSYSNNGNVGRVAAVPNTTNFSFYTAAAGGAQQPWVNISGATINFMLIYPVS